MTFTAAFVAIYGPHVLATFVYSTYDKHVINTTLKPVVNGVKLHHIARKPVNLLKQS